VIFPSSEYYKELTDPSSLTHSQWLTALLQTSVSLFVTKRTTEILHW